MSAHEFLTVAEVATLTRLSPAAVYRAIRRGELRARTVCGRKRIEFVDVEAWLDECYVEPVQQPRQKAEQHPRGLRILLSTDESSR